MITYIKGDLFAEYHPIIAHGCNAQRTMGSGVARIIRDKYPKAYVDYIKAFEDQDKANKYGDTAKLMMGRIIESDTGEKYEPTTILHCITQQIYGKDGRKYVSYDAVDNCMERIQMGFENLMYLDYIAMPKIGSGLGGGHWPVIEAIINHRLKDIDVRVYEYDEKS